MNVVVVDVGCGNTRAVLTMLRRIGVPARPQRRPVVADAVILPGVGAWDAVASRLVSTGWFPELQRHVSEDRPLLGICLGMQLLCASSEEGTLPGLGLIDRPVRRLPAAGRDAMVPRVGWRRTWLRDDDAEQRFYYAHSYAIDAPPDAHEISGSSRHGDQLVPVAVADGAITGCQFHPERSHVHGMGYLRRWAQSLGLGE